MADALPLRVKVVLLVVVVQTASLFVKHKPGAKGVKMNVFMTIDTYVHVYKNV